MCLFDLVYKSDWNSISTTHQDTVPDTVYLYGMRVLLLMQWFDYWNQSIAIGIQNHMVMRNYTCYLSLAWVFSSIETKLKIGKWNILEVTPECLPAQLSNHSKHCEKISASNSDCIRYTWTFMNEKHYNCEMALSNKFIL